MAASGVTSIKSFNYRGNTDEEWSNQYHFVGDPPSDDTGWAALCGQLATMEQEGLMSQVKIVRMYCYEDTDHDSVYTYELADHGGVLTGSIALASGAGYTPGDAAVWIRWKTARVNTHGKPIYLRKYYHGCQVDDNPTLNDALPADYVTGLQALADDLSTAVDAWPGIAGPDGVAPGTNKVSPFVTTRTLKRRGKRPS